MRRFPKLRPCLWDAAVVFAAAALALLPGALLRTDEAQRLEAVVYINGTETERTALNGEAREETLTGRDGYTLLASFSPEGVRVISADCPTQDCVHTGTISRAGQSIVCLPARIVLRLEGGAPDPAAPDAVLR